MDKLKILIVDDTPSVRKFIRLGLEKNFENLEIDESNNGLNAQIKLENNHFDLVLCDWEMPGIKGDQLLSWMKSHPVLCTTPFVMVSARNEKEDVIKAIQGGVAAYIVKPFTIDSLIQKITSVVEKFDRRQYERFEANSPLCLEFRSKALKGRLVDISLGGLLGIFDKKQQLPNILENVVTSLETDNAYKIPSLDSFVLRIQAAEPFPDTEYIKVAVKFFDLDSDKRECVVRYLESLNKHDTKHE